MGKEKEKKYPGKNGEDCRLFGSYPIPLSKLQFYPINN